MNAGSDKGILVKVKNRAGFAARAIAALLLVVFAAVPYSRAEKDENERFKDVEVRVIRPKYFTKAKRFELGAQLTVIMNETFIYSFLATGLATYHFTESIALEAFLSYGFNIEKEDKRVLFDEFDIRTKIFRTTYQMGGVLQYTPIYGKWQLPSGRLVYFDTFLSFGGGMTGVTYKYSDFCTPPTKEGAAPIPDDATKAYPTFIAGIGQRYYLDKKTAIKWDIRGNFYFYNQADAECDPTSSVEGSATNNNITLQLGASKFF
jgi:outer membrane beta-barrel protein